MSSLLSRFLATDPYQEPPQSTEHAVVSLVVLLTLKAWGLTVYLMSGMDLGPGTDLHSLPVFVLGWVLMLTAMMLPSELSYLAAFSAILRTGQPPTDSTAYRWLRIGAFLSGYLLAWLFYGLVAFAIDKSIRLAKIPFLSWDQAGPYLAGSVLVAAGLYQASSLKDVCLTHCRSPLSYFAHSWQAGVAGSANMGLRHGLYCVACCWALMAIMFAVGSMNLTWMAILTVLMFAEKVGLFPRELEFSTALLLVVLGVWMAASPESFPFLQQPGEHGLESMHRHHH